MTTNPPILDLPTCPGVYLFKDAYHTIIYIGKAKNLQKRVSSYFQKTDNQKIIELIAEHAQVSHVSTRTEAEALILEADLIRQYQPKYNVLLKAGNPFLYLLFTAPSSGLPTLELVRHKKRKGSHFGPFLHKKDARSAYDYLLNTFQLASCNKSIIHGCLEYHIGRCSGTCKPDFDQEEYVLRLNLAREALRGNHKKFLQQLKSQIKHYSNELAFEKAARLNSYLKNFETIFTTIKARYHDKKYADEIAYATLPEEFSSHEKENALTDLQSLLRLSFTPQTIDCFDISHFQSSHLVGSCIRFTNGQPEPNKFRRFTIRSISQQNDYAALQEIIKRRYKKSTDLPDIVLIDGGIGQRNAVLHLLPNTTCISLAKREERLITNDHPQGIKLNIHNPASKLLISLRDYAHHFAISYHRLKRSKKFT